MIIHHLRLFGITEARRRDDGCIAVGNDVVIRLAHPDEGAERHVREDVASSGRLQALAGQGKAWGRLRTFHPCRAWPPDGAEPIVETPEGEAVWVWRSGSQGGELLIGTDLAADLTLIRQGNPAAASQRPSEPMWGYEGERPTYLFEGLIDRDAPEDRMADWWMWTLRDALIRHGGAVARDLLPFGAPGAVVVTGDDDQAPLDDYDAQARKLGRLPVTYFLHPLTKHDAASLTRLARGRTVEWELHPDALDAPGEYGPRLREQCRWFAELVGRRPRLARNHGFLNDGYWGHARHWLAEGVIGSSNLPGVDGRVLNGSLLPARLLLEGELTPHWSQLTAFGDGVFFVYDWTAEQALAAIATMGRNIVESGVPGLVVLNLHPANHAKAAAMHEAAHLLVRERGFAAMTLGDALAWLSVRDEGGGDASTERMTPPYSDARADTIQEPSVTEPVARKPDGLAGKAINLIARLAGKKRVA